MFKVRPKNPFKVKASATDLIPGTLNDKISITGLGTKSILNSGANEVLEISVTDPASTKVKISSADTTANFLENKLVAGSGVTLSKNSPSGNETISISVATPGRVVVTTADTGLDVLNNKIAVGTGLSKATTNPGSNETLTLSNPNSTKVAATSADTTPDYLNNKVTAGDWMTKSTLNPSGNESVKMNFAPSAAVSLSGTAIDWSNPNHTFYKTLAANTTFTFTNTVEGKTIIVALTNTVSNFTVTWPAGIKWRDGTAPVMTVGAVTDIYTFVMINAIIYGAVLPRCF